jgi:hypothetical protein
MLPEFTCATCQEKFKIETIEDILEYHVEFDTSMEDILDWEIPYNSKSIICLSCLRLEAQAEKELAEKETNTETVEMVQKMILAENYHDPVTEATTTSSESEEYWTTEVKILESCSEAPSSVPVILKPLVKLKMDELMKIFTNIEWLGYFTGVNGNNKFVIDDIIIPEQTVTGTSVTNVKYSVPEGKEIIGVVHSHHNMGSFFSGTDREFINSNHNLSIVVSHSSMKGQVRWKAKCGGYKIVDANISIDYGIDFDLEEFKKDVLDKVHSYKYEAVRQNVFYDVYGTGICSKADLFGRYVSARRYKRYTATPGKKNEIPIQLRGQNHNIPYIKKEREKDPDEMTLEDEISKMEREGAISVRNTI